MNTLILKVASRLMVGLILIFAIYLLLRGHHSPGGGFAAALVAGTGFVLYFIAEGTAPVRRTLRVHPASVAGLGLLTALTAGLLGPLSGRPFLTGLWLSAGNTALGAIELGTPLLFDVGVFLAVLGAILTVLLALEEF
ncbi:MAG: MnhB domain-containing protein [Desulfosarcinaceae bacterium]|nr:MnhB domain-containing protein [Desulfosarcinaceae bacterium]